LTGAVHLANNTIFSDADVRCIQQNNVAVFGDVMAEGTPACLSGEGNAGKTSKMEHFAIAVAHQARDILTEFIMVQLIRARALSKDSIIFADSKLLELTVDNLVNLSTWKCTGKVLVD